MRILASLLISALLIGVGTTARAPATDEKVKIDDKSKKAMEQALDWLKDTQRKDGS